jgi:hypothetical protein
MVNQLTFSYTSGANNNQNTVIVNNSSGGQVMNQNNPPAGFFGPTITAVCTDPNNVFSWTPSTGLSATNIYNPVATPSTTTTYQVTVTNPPSGCSGTQTVTVTVATPLTPLFNPLDDVCQYAPVPILPTTSNNGISGTWSPAVSTNVPGTFTYSFTPVQGALPCPPNPTTITLTVLPETHPACALPCFATADNGGPYCAGQSISLFADGGNSYSWTGPNGFTSTAQNPVIPNSTIANSGNYTVTVTLDGCTSMATTTVTVNPLPTVNAGQDVSICPGGSVTLLASGNAISYTWNNGVTNGVAFTPGASQTYEVTGQSSQGCVNTDQVNVTVNPLPPVDAGPNQSVCVGGSVTLSGSGAANYSWTGGVTNGVPFTPANTATYTVTGTDANGCQNTDDVTVTVLNSAPIDAGANQTICSGQSATLLASGGVTYTWDNGLGAGAAHSVSPGTTTTYTVTGVDNNNCQGTDQVVINVLPLPTATISGATQVCQNGTSPTITFTGANGTAPYTFTYTLNGATQTVTSAGNTATVSVPTGTAGTFTYALVSVQDASSSNVVRKLKQERQR